MLVRRIARPLLSAAFIGQGIEALRDVKPAAEVVQPTLDGLQSLPSPVSDKVPDNAVTVARINAAVQIGGGLLLALLILPLYIPVLILGSGALQAALQGLPASGHLLWLASLTALAVTLTPFAIAAGLTISVGE